VPAGQGLEEEGRGWGRLGVLKGPLWMSEKDARWRARWGTEAPPAEEAQGRHREGMPHRCCPLPPPLRLWPSSPLLNLLPLALLLPLLFPGTLSRCAQGCLQEVQAKPWCAAVGLGSRLWPGA